MSEDRIFYLGPIVVGMIAILIAYIRIWAIVKDQRREGLKEIKENNDAIKRDLRDYVNLRLDNLNNEMKHMREWITKIEDKVNNKNNNRNRDH